MGKVEMVIFAIESKIHGYHVYKVSFLMCMDSYYKFFFRKCGKAKSVKSYLASKKQAMLMTPSLCQCARTIICCRAGGSGPVYPVLAGPILASSLTELIQTLKIADLTAVCLPLSGCR